MSSNVEEEILGWQETNSQAFEVSWGKRNIRWPSYWGVLLKPYRASNRVGETSRFILNVKSFIYWFWRNSALRKADRVGWYGDVLWRPSEDALPGSFRWEIFVGLLMGRSVTARFKRAGEWKWKYVGSAKYSEPCYQDKDEGYWLWDSLLAALFLPKNTCEKYLNLRRGAGNRLLISRWNLLRGRKSSFRR